MSMKRALRTTHYSYHSPHHPPQFTVAQGEEFLAETELCTGAWLFSKADTWSHDKTNALNPTVVVAVEGAKPGDLLAVDILDVTPDSVGYTGQDPERNKLMNRIYPYDWGMNTKTVEIKDGFVIWSDDVKLPIAPMIGTLGTAPATEVLSNARADKHGGNMDVQEVCPGSTVYLPVECEGALLHIGDVHAIQGDGEICCSGGIECRSVVRLRARVLPRPSAYGCVRIENDDYIMTVASDRALEGSFHTAARELLLWMEQEHALPVKEGYLLMGQVLEARNTQFVNPTWSYICKMPKRYLPVK